GLRFLPQALVLPLIPLYSRSAVAQGDRADFRDAYVRSMKSFLLMGFPFALLFIFCPATLTTGLLGHNYLAAAPAMRLLGFGIWLVFLTTPFPFLLTALDRQRFMFISATISFAIRVGLDIALIHYLGFIGPCISLIVSESFILAAWIWCVWQDGFALQLADLLWRPLVASVLMSAVLYWFHPQSLLTLAPIAMLAGVLYMAIVLKLGGLSEVDMALLREGAEFIRPWLSQRFGQLRGRFS
ncbi:MAG: lipopolysaccharide biosynthesis protein, partial [Caulobacteraceae bacterium]